MKKVIIVAVLIILGMQGFSDELDPGPVDRIIGQNGYVVITCDRMNLGSQLITRESGLRVVVFLEPQQLMVPRTMDCPSVLIVTSDRDVFNVYSAAVQLCNGDDCLAGKIQVRFTQHPTKEVNTNLIASIFGPGAIN